MVESTAERTFGSTLSAIAGKNKFLVQPGVQNRVVWLMKRQRLALLTLSQWRSNWL